MDTAKPPLHAAAAGLEFAPISALKKIRLIYSVKYAINFLHKYEAPLRSGPRKFRLFIGKGSNESVFCIKLEL